MAALQQQLRLRQQLPHRLRLRQQLPHRLRLRQQLLLAQANLLKLQCLVKSSALKNMLATL